MNNHDTILDNRTASIEIHETRMGAVTKRHHLLTDDPPENDFIVSEATPSTTADSDSSHISNSPLNVEHSDHTDTPFMHHRRMEFEATLQSQRNKTLLLTRLEELAPRGRLSLVRNKSTLWFLFFVDNLHRLHVAFFSVTKRSI
jgi:hypothetical protein